VDGYPQQRCGQREYACLLQAERQHPAQFPMRFVQVSLPDEFHVTASLVR
jgi:hypothetical protein